MPLRSLSTLFVGQNEQVAGQGNVPGQEVFSFVAPENMTSFSQLDVFPLFQYLLDGKRMANSTYLGTAQFGSEAFHTYGNNVTFEASGVDMYINTTAIPPTKTKGSPAKTNGATITTGASAKSHTASAKSNAVSLRGVEGFHWCWGLFEGAMGAMGAWMLWSWIL